MRRCLLMFLPALGVGCAFDPSVQGPDVRCAADSECPPGTTCVAGLCESLLRPFTAVELSPARARAGDTVALKVKTDRAIRSARATLDIGGQRLAFEGPRALQPELQFNLPLTGNEPSGRGTVHLWLVDGAGNSYPNLLVGEVTLDFEGPSLVAPRLRLVPRDDNRLVQLGAGAALTAATVGTVVRLTFALDDEVLSAPTVLATSLGDGGTQVLSPALETDGPGRYAYEAEIVGGLWPEGVYALTVAATDTLANSATRPAGQLTVDLTAPSPPRVALPGGVVYRRAPFGDAAHPGAPWFSLRGLPGATEGAGAVAVYSRGVPVGGAVSDADGGFAEFALTLVADQPAVSVGFVDGAGNASPLVGVLDSEWVGWFGPGLAQSPDNTVLPQTVTEERLLEDGVPAIPARDWPLTVAGGLRTVSQGGVAPAACQGTCLYLPAKGRTDGLDDSPDGVPSASPRARFDDTFNVVVDEAVVPFFDRSAAFPSPRLLSTPVVRLEARPAWDSARDRTVFLGTPLIQGAVQQTYLGHWSDAGLLLLEAVGGDAGPPPRADTTLVFDEARGETVLFGGAAADGGVLSDTWLLSAAGWRAASTDAGGPSPRSAAALAYDSDRERVVLFGGRAPSGLLADTWEWDGAAWTQRPVGAPAGRAGASLTYDVARRRLLLGAGTVADAGVAFTQTTPLVLPTGAADWRPLPQRWNRPWARPFCHDPSRRLSFGYGGAYTVCTDYGDGSSCDEFFSGETAIDDGTTLSTSTLPLGPGPLADAALACAPQGPLLFAGRTQAAGSVSGVWRYDVAAKAWSAVVSTGTAPSGPGVQAVWSEAEQAVVALQGSTVFRFAGGAWTSGPLVGAPGTLFELASGVGLVSNSGVKAKVAQLTGAVASPLLEVPAFSAGLVAGDRASQQFLLWGSNPESRGLRLYSGTMAQAYDSTTPPFDGAAALWVPSLQRVTRLRDGILDIELDGAARPGLVLTFALRPAAIPEGSSWSRLDVAARASASSATAAGPSGEVQLEAFRSGRWVSGLFTAQQPSGAFGGSTRDARTLSRLLDGRGALHLRVSPVGTNGSGRAEVTVEHLEVVLAYRRKP